MTPLPTGAQSVYPRGDGGQPKPPRKTPRTRRDWPNRNVTWGEGRHNLPEMKLHSSDLGASLGVVSRSLTAYGSG